MTAPQDWMLCEIKFEAARLVRDLRESSLTEADCFDIAIGMAYEKAQSRLPLEDAGDLYCDIDAHYPQYVAAVQSVLASRQSE